MWRILGPLEILALASCTSSRPSDEKTACIGQAENPMIWVPGGTFTMGEDPRYSEEGPSHTVYVKGFWMNAHEVTNAEFAAFVKATRYRTMAERKPPTSLGTPLEMQIPGSAVFNVPTQQANHRRTIIRA